MRFVLWGILLLVVVLVLKMLPDIRRYLRIRSM